MDITLMKLNIPSATSILNKSTNARLFAFEKNPNRKVVFYQAYYESMWDNECVYYIQVH